MAINNHPVNNLYDGEAVSRLKKIVEAAEVCMFETILPEPPFSARPMSPVKVTNEGTFWFFSNKESKKNKEITANPHVQLLFCNSHKNEFLNIYGSAEIVTGKKKFEELWTPVVRAWFPEGIKDPNLSLIKVIPESSYYWDTKHNKMAAIIKIAVSVMGENAVDDRTDGILHV
ncbi:MAG: pyridoxamine 5'-phosphate oxidase family protein [Bacteroidia bacterium]